MCSIAAFRWSLSVRTLSTPSSIAWASVSIFTARAMPRPRWLPTVPVNPVQTRPPAGGYLRNEKPTMRSPSSAIQVRSARWSGELCQVRNSS